MKKKKKKRSWKGYAVKTEDGELRSVDLAPRMANLLRRPLTKDKIIKVTITED